MLLGISSLNLCKNQLALGNGTSFYADFTSGNQSLDKRITFSRASNATVTGSNGLIQYAPHNLLTYSEQFDNAAWSKSNVTITANNTVAPDGTTTADKFASSAAAGNQVFLSQTVTYTLGVSYTVSSYFKQGETRYLQITYPSANFGSSQYANFDLQTGTIAYQTGGTAAITSVGNGWYRCSWTAACTTAGSTSSAFFWLVDSGSATRAPAYSGGIGAGLYIWGAQAETRSSASTYNPTTVKNLLGFSEAFDNAAWTKTNSFVQTNLLTYSEQFDNVAWSKTGTLTANDAVSPTGTLTADKLSSGTSNLIGLPAFVTVTSGVAYTASVWLKSAVVGQPATLRLNLSKGQATPEATLSVTTTDQWVRYTITHTTTSTGLFFQIGEWSTLGYGPTKDIYVWGAQLVQGSVAGDYQATYAASAAVQYQAPNGTLTADLVQEDTANANHRFYSGTVTLSGTNTASVYVKPAGRSFVQFGIWNSSSGVFDAVAVFNLTDGTTSSVTGTVTATSVGNGWYRLSATGAYTASNRLYVRLLESVTVANYTGDGSSGIYIWGAQLSDSASVDTYVNNPVAAPSAAAYYGPRFDYDPVTLQPKGLLIEEQRTNLLVNSVMTGAVVGAPGTQPTGWTQGAVTGEISAIGASSYTAGNKLTFSVNTTRRGIYRTIAVSANTSYTFTADYSGLTADTSVANLITVTALPTGATITTYLLNGVSVVSTATVSAGTTGKIGVVVAISTTTGSPAFQIGLGLQSNLTTRSVSISNPQVEAGTFSTSYIPTIDSQVTRSADVALIQGSNFSGFYNQNEGSFYVDVAAGSASYATYITDGTDNNYIVAGRYASSGTAAVIATNGTLQANFGSGALTAKVGLAYKVNDFAVSTNGGTIATDTSGLIPVVNQMKIGAATSGLYINGTIKKIAYYPRRLTNSELQAITS